jgi:hypothetical protein
MSNVLSKATIIAALARLAELLRSRNVEGEICVLGDTVMVLAFDARPTTKDVDAIFEPTSTIRHLSEIVARELGLEEDWLNDGAKGFTSSHHDVSTEDMPQFDGLRILAPSAEYLLAMKCMASRTGLGATDTKDIRFLLAHLGISTVEQALDNIVAYYPANRVPSRTRFLLEELLESETPEL